MFYLCIRPWNKKKNNQIGAPKANSKISLHCFALFTIWFSVLFADLGMDHYETYIDKFVIDFKLIWTCEKRRIKSKSTLCTNKAN